MAKKPTGAMGAGHAVPSFSDARGNPPRYRNLPQSEAWAKIDAEDKERAVRREENILEAKVQERLAQLNLGSPAPVADSPAPEKETPTNKFTSEDLTSVLVALQPISDITDTTLSVIYATIAGVKVEILKV